MRPFFKVTLVVALLVIFVLQAVYWVLPSIKVINNSGLDISQAIMKLPKSNLDFGAIKNGEHNAIYYSLEQKDGTILYKFTLSNGKEMNGSCMYIYNNMVNARVLVFVEPQEVVCELDT